MADLLPHEKRFLKFLSFDLVSLWTLAATQSEGWLGIAMIFAGLAITFGSAAMGIGIMSRARYDEDQ